MCKNVYFVIFMIKNYSFLHIGCAQPFHEKHILHIGGAHLFHVKHIFTTLAVLGHFRRKKKHILTHWLCPAISWEIHFYTLAVPSHFVRNTFLHIGCAKPFHEKQIFTHWLCPAISWDLHFCTLASHGRMNLVHQASFAD